MMSMTLVIVAFMRNQGAKVGTANVTRTIISLKHHGMVLMSMNPLRVPHLNQILIAMIPKIGFGEYRNSLLHLNIKKN